MLPQSRLQFVALRTYQPKPAVASNQRIVARMAPGQTRLQRCFR
jgi:hypothetical protein